MPFAVAAGLTFTGVLPAPSAGQTIVLQGILLLPEDVPNTEIYVRDTDDNDLLGTLQYPGGTPFVLPYVDRGWATAAPAAGVKIRSITCAVSGIILYTVRG